ncbi:MAG: chromosomal replication initiator protein DnaA [Kiritimatiellae bacterium]|nr:chromosomal replication initiator protein DnaA [Kiritimatiellia bacterium]MBR4190968.1 chromosomal replication initiator protein DnaA [Kiritimatiellia bacterium]
MQEKQAIEYWKKAREFLAEVLSPDIYERWIGVIDAAGDDLGDSQLTLTVPNDFYQDWLVENFMPHIRKALSAAGCENPAIHFAVDASRQLREMPEERLQGGVPPAAPAKSSSRKAAVRSCNVGSPLNPKNTFENFVVGPSNTFAHAAALAVVEAPGRAYNPLFIHGGTGLGKTHLIQAMGDAVLKGKKGTVCYISSEKFTNEYIQAIQQHAIADFRKKYRGIDMLLIDDIHFLAGKEGIQEEFFHTFNTLYENQKQIVLTSDRPVSEIANLQKRLVSRFEWGLVTEMEMANLETRVAILRRKREQMDLQVPDDALFFIAEHIRSNIRKLEGSLLRVTSYLSLTKKALTQETLEYLLRDTLEQENQTALTIEGIQRLVAEHYDIRLGDMTSKQRPQNIAFPRQVAMYLCREMTGQSLPAIGNAFGRNHATVLHAHRLIGQKMKTDAALRQTILSLEQRLGTVAAPN